MHVMFIYISNLSVTPHPYHCRFMTLDKALYLWYLYPCDHNPELVTRRPISVKTTPLPLPHDDTQQGSLNVQGPHPRPVRGNDATLTPLSRPDHRRNPLCICCLPCSCPCPAPRVYPLPARTSRRLRGGHWLAVTVMSLAGGRRGP